MVVEAHRDARYVPRRRERLEALAPVAGSGRHVVEVEIDEAERVERPGEVELVAQATKAIGGLLEHGDGGLIFGAQPVDVGDGPECLRDTGFVTELPEQGQAFGGVFAGSRQICAAHEVREGGVVKSVGKALPVAKRARDRERPVVVGGSSRKLALPVNDATHCR